MLDLSDTIVAKSDQLNASELMGGAITVTITKVSKTAGDQPVTINYENDNGKPFKPCKSMLRVLIHAWGRDGLQWVGRSMTLFRNEKVKWAGEEVGGIRISHMSHIDKELTIALAETRKSIKSVKIKPLTGAPAAPAKSTPSDADKLAAATKKAEAFIKAIQAAKDDEQLAAATDAATMKRLEDSYPDLYLSVMDAMEAKVSELQPEELSI